MKTRAGEVEISIVIPALKPPTKLIGDLRKQTFKDFEIVIGGGDSIPKGLNDGIRRARGRKIIFLESDVRVFERTWLERMHALLNTHKIVKADQVLLQDPPADSYNNLGLSSEIAKGTLFDESYRVSEDVEWFQHLRSKGYKIERVRSPIVWHFKKIHMDKMVDWSFNMGVAYSRVAMSYKNPDMNFKRMFLSRASGLGSEFLMLCGEIWGLIISILK